MKALAYLLIYSNIFVGLCAAALTFSCCIALNLNYYSSLVYSVSVGLMVSGSYCLQRFYFSLKSAPVTTRDRWYQTHKTAIAVFIISTLLLATVLLLYFFSIVIFLWLAPAAMLTLLYYRGPLPLRNIMFLKSLIVGATWSYTSVFVPSVMMHAEDWQLTLWLFISMSFFVSALCIPFNIRDVRDDARRRIHSLPVVAGIHIARIFGIFLCVLYGIAAFVATGEVYFRIAVVITALTSAFLIFISTPQRHAFFFSYLVDGMMLLQCLLYVVIKLAAN